MTINQEATESVKIRAVLYKSKVLSDGKVEFTITGEWPFPDPTGIISPHSEKPVDKNTAGGNGIGLKQTAIRYLRDFSVNRFEIHGENWVANYELANADEINQSIDKTFQGTKQQNIREMRHDWLIAGLKANNEQGKNFVEDIPRRVVRDTPYDFDPNCFQYQGKWIKDQHRYAHFLVAKNDFEITNTTTKKSYFIQNGESFHVINSFKFPVPMMEQAAQNAGWKSSKTWTKRLQRN